MGRNFALILAGKLHDPSKINPGKTFSIRIVETILQSDLYLVKIFTNLVTDRIVVAFKIIPSEQNRGNDKRNSITCLVIPLVLS